jgi:hypothetical protein
MLRSGASGRLSCRNKVFLPVLNLALATSVLLSAQTGPPKYDLHTETKLKGAVEEIKLPLKGNEKDVVHLLIRKMGRRSLTCISAQRRLWTTWA